MTHRPFQPAVILAIMLTVSAAGAQSTLPFVGCASDGQLGPRPAAHGKPVQTKLPPTVAAQLAFYQEQDGLAVIAPRGWNCFSTYGSNGTSLFVSPTPIDSKLLFDPDWKGFEGPAVQESVSFGGTSGRFEVAQIIALIFPSFRSFTRSVIAEGIESASSFHYGPYSTDHLRYISRKVVQYETPSNTQGLGTRSRLRKNASPIRGVITLQGGGPDDLNLFHLAVRLPPDLTGLTPAILQQAEN